MSQRIDVHQHITDRIIAAIEQGAGKFNLPWHRPARSIARPTNIESGKGYRGINVGSLWIEAQLKGYAVPVWGTYKPMAAAGYHVRKGEKASLEVFYKELEFAREDAKPEDHDQTRSAWLARGYFRSWIKLNSLELLPFPEEVGTEAGRPPLGAPYPLLSTSGPYPSPARRAAASSESAKLAGAGLYYNCDATGSRVASNAVPHRPLAISRNH